MGNSDTDAKHITVREMNHFLSLAGMPAYCPICGSGDIRIPADDDEDSPVYEISCPVSNSPEVKPMTYATTVCAGCGHTQWFWKEGVLRLLESSPFGASNAGDEDE